MQQIVFKREFFVIFDAFKTENEQYLEEKIQPIKKIVIQKIQKKSLKIDKLSSHYASNFPFYSMQSKAKMCNI